MIWMMHTFLERPNDQIMTKYSPVQTNHLNVEIIKALLELFNNEPPQSLVKTPFWLMTATLYRCAHIGPSSASRTGLSFFGRKCKPTTRYLANNMHFRPSHNMKELKSGVSN